MANPTYSTVTYTGNGVNQNFAVPFPFLSQSDIFATVNGVNSAFNWANATTIHFIQTPPNGSTVFIYRLTNLATPEVVFNDGATLRAEDLNTFFTQLLYGDQEGVDNASFQVYSGGINGTITSLQGSITGLQGNITTINGTLTSLQSQINGLSTTNLPAVSGGDNNDLLLVSGGMWTKATPSAVISALGLSSGANLPATTGADNNDLLLVAGGVWTKGTPSAVITALGLSNVSLPAVSGADNNDVLGVVAGAWAKVTPSAARTALGLGTAATVNTGTGGSQVPLNSNLGALAYDGLLSTGGLNTSGSSVYVRGFQVVTSDPASLQDGDVWYNSTTNSMRRRDTGATLGNSSCIYRASADSGTVNNSNTFQIPAFFTLPANFMTVGRTIRLRFSVRWVAKDTSQTLFIAASTFPTGGGNWASTYDGPTLGTPQGTGPDRAFFQVDLTCRSTGANGTMEMCGLYNTTGSVSGPLGTTTTLYSFNTTVSNFCGVGFQWGVADPGNSVLVSHFTAEILDT